MLIIPPTDKNKKSFTLPVIATGFLKGIHKQPFSIFVKRVITFDAREIDYHVHVHLYRTLQFRARHISKHDKCICYVKFLAE
jgi:hypothetical protein